MSAFTEKVYKLVKRIPVGRVMTYGAIARTLGDPRKAREVGWAMHGCPTDVPAHRVINRMGALSGDSYGAERRLLLEGEGVQFDRAGRCDLSVYEWSPPVRSRGLPRQAHA